MRTPRVRLSGIARRFGPVVALAGAELELHAGEVHGLLGENGAGKTTLLRILGGAQRPNAGTIELEGERVGLRSPRDAWTRGIGLVHQHFSLVPTLTVLENLALGHRSASSGWRLPYDGIRRRALELARRTQLEVPLGARIETLSVGDRQRVEILKALLREPGVLALDEPTAVLAPGEIESLFSLLRELASEGRAVVLVAHKLDEVLAVADRVTVLRGGRTVLTARVGEVDAPGLVRAMVGQGSRDTAALGAVSSPQAVGSAEVAPGSVVVTPGSVVAAPGPVVVAPASAEVTPGSAVVGPGSGVSAAPSGTAEIPAPRPRRHPTGAPVASLDDVRLKGQRGSLALDGVTLEVRRGEIVGIAGVEGNGQRELAGVLAGRVRPDGGVVRLPRGIGFIPQDRSTEGIIGDFDLAENVALSVHGRQAMRWGPLLRWGELRRRAEELRVRYRIRAPGVDTAARALSGGNQQRLVVARELAIATDLLVAENPTRGLDVEASAFVHAELERIVGGGRRGAEEATSWRSEAAGAVVADPAGAVTPPRGAAADFLGPAAADASEPPCVLLVSTDLDEVLALSDRVLTMVRGRLTPVPEDRRTREGVGALMLGAGAEEGEAAGHARGASPGDTRDDGRVRGRRQTSAGGPPSP